MYKNIIRGIINKKTGHALTISAGTVYTYYYKNNKRDINGSIGCWSVPYGPCRFDRLPAVTAVIKEYLQ